MTKTELELIENIDKTKDKPICADDLKPFLKDRTLLYGYTCDRRTFHVYIKGVKIYTVIYDNDYSGDKIKPKNIKEISVKSNYDYIPDKRLYPETCDYQFCKLLKKCDINLPFTGFNEERLVQDFYGFTLEDCE